MLWAGSLVTHGFWESAGCTGDLVCPQGPTSGCDNDLGQGLGSELGRMRGSLLAFMGNDDRGPVSLSLSFDALVASAYRELRDHQEMVSRL